MLNSKSGSVSKKGRKGEIAKPDALPNNLDRVFVVQFRDRTEPGSAHFARGAEHLISGENAGFERPEELVDFLARIMHQLKPQSQKRIGQ